MGALGTVCTGFNQYLKKISTKVSFDVIQKTALLGTGHGSNEKEKIENVLKREATLLKMGNKARGHMKNMKRHIDGI